MSIGVRHLYLIRHARAEERGPEWPNDELRPLTEEGNRRFSVGAQGLARLDGIPEVVLTSPLVRARQTAELLVAATRPRARLIPAVTLAPGATPEAVMNTVASVHPATRIAIVGHEPDLGILAGYLLGTRATIPFKKGAVCRIDLAGTVANLVWFLPPAALRALARS